MDTNGKYLTDLIQEMDEKGRYARTVFDNQACICWQENGTFTYFDYEDGFPGVYYAEYTDFANNLEDFTSFGRFVAFLKKFFTDEYTLYLLSSPVWITKPIAQEAQPVRHLKLVR